MVFNCNYDGLNHFVADNLTHAGFSQISFHDLCPPVLFGSVCLLSDYCLDSGNIFTNLFDSSCIV